MQGTRVQIGLHFGSQTGIQSASSGGPRALITNDCQVLASFVSVRVSAARHRSPPRIAETGRFPSKLLFRLFAESTSVAMDLGFLWTPTHGQSLDVAATVCLTGRDGENVIEHLLQ
jgi:hypothetical protein